MVENPFECAAMPRPFTMKLTRETPIAPLFTIKPMSLPIKLMESPDKRHEPDRKSGHVAKAEALESN